MIILNTVLLRLSGSLAVAAFSIVMYVDSVVKSLLFGMADSLQPALSYNYGAGNRKRILALERWVLGAAALLSAATMLWMLLGGEQILALFRPDQRPRPAGDEHPGDAALLALLSVQLGGDSTEQLLHRSQPPCLFAGYGLLSDPCLSAVLSDAPVVPARTRRGLADRGGGRGAFHLLAAALLLFVLRGLRRQESPRQ